MSFKKWFSLDEIMLGSDGMRDNQATQTAQATSQVAQRWLGQDTNASLQAGLINGAGNRSTLANKLMNVGADAIEAAPSTVASKTTAPAVAGFVQNQFKLPNVIKTPTTGGKFMRKNMRKK